MRPPIALSLTLLAGCLLLAQPEEPGGSTCDGAEVPYDGIDNDCDAATPDDDLDGDGYTSQQSGGADCDDAQSAVSPAGLDDDSDGIDQNCDGIDGTDADGDGYASEATGGGDCDDGDGSRYPGATEICGDGVINDCGGSEAEALEECELSGSVSLAEAGARLIGEGSQDEAGTSVSGAGDVNGDGRADVLLGAYSRDEGGVYAGSVYLVLGGVSGTLSLADADARLLGEGVNDYAGRSVAGAGDVDGDSLADLLIGADGLDEGSPGGGGRVRGVGAGQRGEEPRHCRYQAPGRR